MRADAFLFFLILIPFLIWVFVSLFKWLWNITMPQVFGLKEISFWQAFRLLLLAGVLFGSGSFLKFNIGG